MERDGSGRATCVRGVGSALLRGPRTHEERVDRLEEEMSDWD
jgi:hypothetical protein